MHFSTFVTRVALLSLLSAVPCYAANELPRYQKLSGISGNLSSVGSDTLASMSTLWLEEFNTLYPSVNVQIQASGSSTAPPALTEGTAQFGPMSRSMRLKEVAAFEREHGYPPTALRVAIDAIGIFVHEDNPIQGLNFRELDSIFSITLRCGSNEYVKKWSELGINSEWKNRAIQLYGRNSVSGTYGYFKNVALCDGDFRQDVNEQPGSASVVQSVASSINTIGYSGISYRVSGARLVPIANKGTQYIYPTQQNVISGEYPLARYLYVYVDKHPHESLEPLEEAYIRFIYSREGQSIVGQDGFVPLTREFAQQELAKVGLSLE
ncbi:PstS family phosphate ABC transporter substrate-binding protein [Vibrio hippocampi]|uniref:Phosphate-binding protein n=1 Tax=Vibrio hippocampi TaxID=654686 RepID=A0ABN8DDK9_9VIBR|nr:phosphate ABC transporter substrate-binding protein [Vibrio hippocampi]CAH0524843.1 Phosphate-binding protein PstS [Vibrio hippocampi]